jgi:hypothetical protein
MQFLPNGPNVPQQPPPHRAQSIAAERYLGRRANLLLFLLLTALTAYRVGVLHFAGYSLYVDEAQYWTWAQHLDWGYYSKPPIVAAVIAATTAVCGDTELCIKAGSLILYPLAAWLIFEIARRLFDTRTGVWSSIIFVTLPGAALSAMIISTDVPLFLCWTLALYAYVRALDSNQWRWWLLAGFAGGLGLLTKYTMAIFAISVLLHLATSRELRHHLRNPKLYGAFFLAAVLFAPNLWWNAAHGWPTVQHTAEISGLEQRHGLQWHEFIAFLGGQAAILGPVFFLVWILQLALGTRIWTTDPRYRLLACFALPFLLIISVQALFGRANANWAAMSYAAGAIFVVARLIQRKRWGLLVAGVLLNLSVTAIAYHYDWLTHVAGVELNRKSDFYKRVRGWDEIGNQMTAIKAQYPNALLLADERDILAELEYYVHPHPFDAVQWNPHHIIDSHYALVTTMDDKRGRDFLYVTRKPWLSPEIFESFASAQPLPSLYVEIHPDYVLDFSVWLLKDFRGYR